MSPTFNALVRNLAARIDARPHAHGLREARQLVEHVTGHSTAAQIVVGEHVVPASDREQLETLVARREAGEPLQRLLGRAHFWDFEVELNNATLIPRDDTETLVRAALDLLPINSTADIVDVGTGSGIVLLALARERHGITGQGLDISEAAVEQAEHNAKALNLSDRLRFERSNWLEAVRGHVDMIVSNPPYVRDSDKDTLAVEVRDHDPAGALFAGAVGLDAYRALLPACRQTLVPGGHVLVEIGHDQAADVERIGVECGLTWQSVHHDLHNQERVVVFRQPRP